jgi:hypothetical protein
MLDFWIYYQIGLRHIWSIHAFDHLLFLTALTIPFTFKDWKKVLLLVSLFTIGHTVSLVLAVFGVVRIKTVFIEFFILITILITALFSIFSSGKSSKNDNLNLIGFITLFFGIIHGFGFSTYFNIINNSATKEKLLLLSEFALGIESAQLIVVLIVLICSYLAQTVFRFSKRDFILVISSFIIGVVVPMIIQNEIWKR